ncbi:LPP20 family lipoprotein [Seleniivibrio sp.]|uniref:LPP20 family lipoprotein n=1 Tax=Seleniivibrio sp. TaxID=2898801 RepID=UPI0025F82D10|nr:LPP20 family lipoprotein [Seleniivibrio sp.]MCD8554243.1 LPP20 family lipoprotein [Seleniivibrio sp.]
MKTIAVLMIASAVVFGCAAEKKKVVRHNSASSQQMMADAAQQEMEEDIQNGTVTLREPVLGVPQAVKPAEEPKQPLPEKKVSSVMSLKPVTKYPIKNGYPEWFYTPTYDGYIGAVGIAPKQPNGGLAQQKRVARMNAQSGLAKQIDVLVKTELNLESTNVDRATVKYYEQKLSTLTKESADQYLSNYKVKDEWIDDRTGEYYVWMVLEK